MRKFINSLVSKFMLNRFFAESIISIIFGLVIVLTSIFIPGADIIMGCVIGGLFLIAGIVGVIIECIAKNNKE